MLFSNPMKMVRCPQCKKEIEYSTANVFRPFCSDRCKTNDLGQWAEESFRVPLFEYDENDLEVIESLIENSENPQYLSETLNRTPADDEADENSTDNLSQRLDLFGDLGNYSQSNSKNKQKH